MMVNPRYLVEIDGDAEALKRLPGLFRGLDFNITAEPDGRVFLSSASFETCATPDEVRESASQLLRWLASVLEVYAGASDDFTVKNIFWKDHRGHLMKRMIWTGTFRALGNFKDLAACSPSNTTLGSDLLRLASIDDDTARAFDLIGGKAISWYEIYDLIDLMGNIRGIEQQGWATRKQDLTFAKPQTITDTWVLPRTSTRCLTTRLISMMHAPLSLNYSASGSASASRKPPS